MQALKTRRFFDQGGRPPFVCRSQPLLVDAPFVQRVASRAAVNELVFDAWSRGPNPIIAGVSYDGSDFAARKFRLAVHTNFSTTKGADFIAAINLFTNALYRSIRPANGSEMTIAGLQIFPEPETKNGFDLISILGPVFYMYIFQLLLPVFLSTMVQEKEMKLREIMFMMGLKKRAYWLVNYLFNLLLYTLATTFMVVVAALLGFRFFTENSFIVYFILFFLWGNVLIALALTMNPCFTKSRTATVVGYLYVFGT
jgi:hypothetical protein